MNRKAVFFDIDGTLYDFKTGISSSTKEAIRLLREKGHYAFICTGRSKACLYESEVVEMEFDGIIAACGTHIMMNDENILKEELSPELLEKTVQIIKEHQMDPVFEGENYLYYDHKRFVEELKDPFMIGMEASIPERMHDLPEDISQMHANKYCVFFRELDAGNEGVKKLEEDYTIIHIHDRLKEIIPKGFNKATGIEFVCRRLGIRREDTYAFGDSANDIDMLKAVGCGIAMGNASPAAKAAADYVTAGILEDGIQKGLRYFGLI